MPAKDRLRHLLELAADPRAETRHALKREVEELLAGWQDDDEARAPFEALLHKIAHEDANEPRLINQLRSGDRDGAIAILAALGHADAGATSRALTEDSGAELAALCHAAGLSRTAFSDVAILAGPARGAELSDMKRVLDAFEAATDDSGIKQVRFA